MAFSKSSSSFPAGNGTVGKYGRLISYIIILYLIKQTIHFLHGDINELYSPAAFGKQVIYIAGHQPRRRISQLLFVFLLPRAGAKAL